jgi:hypothetical protein
MSVEVAEFGQSLGDGIHEAMVQYQNNAARTQQATARVLGMSDLGGCREFIRATVAGEPRDSKVNLKWAAAVGTAVGDWVENAIEAMFPEAVTQETITLDLKVKDDLVIHITGHLDARIGRTAIVDIKTKNGLAEVRRQGASWENLVQVSGYLVGSHQMGIVDDDASAHLVYLDRAGSDTIPHVVSIPMERALSILEANSERLQDVATALATGRTAPRDKPESWCFNVGCPFYKLCWTGYEPTDIIEHADELKAVEEFVEARAKVNEWTSIRLAKRAALKGIEGVTTGLDKEYVVRWSVTAGERAESEKLEVREVKE